MKYGYFIWILEQKAWLASFYCTMTNILISLLLPKVSSSATKRSSKKRREDTRSVKEVQLKYNWLKCSEVQWKGIFQWIECPWWKWAVSYEVIGTVIRVFCAAIEKIPPEVIGIMSVCPGLDFRILHALHIQGQHAKNRNA